MQQTKIDASSCNHFHYFHVKVNPRPEMSFSLSIVHLLEHMSIDQMLARQASLVHFPKDLTAGILVHLPETGLYNCPINLGKLCCRSAIQTVQSEKFQRK